MSGKSYAGDIVRLTVEDLGGLGDGIARHQGTPVYIPLAAPGDEADILIEGPRGDGVAGRLMNLVRAGETRRLPPCPYFGACGGCALQHLAPDVYSRWKEGLIGAVLGRPDRGATFSARGVKPARHGMAAEIRPMRAPEPDDPLALRRRAMFTGENRDGAVTVGFNARATHKIIPIGRCLLLTPAFDRLLGALPELMGAFLGDNERGQAAVTDLSSPGEANFAKAGLAAASESSRQIFTGGGDSPAAAMDVLIVAPRPPGRHAGERIAAIARAHRIARVSWRAAGGLARAERTTKDENAAPDVIVQHEPCRISLAGASVDFPPGGFLQPSAWGEATLQRLVTEGMGKAARVAELFAGIGTFAFALAAAWGGSRWKTAAFERDPALGLALRHAANRAGLSGKLSVEIRDLDRRPLLADEFRDLDGVVLDPPRTGAKAQCQILARAEGPTRAVMVSCNPATFARDARILADGGWRLDHVTPVDQFRYSAHLELVAVFTRAKPSRRGR
ncbi:MAG: class I SAM-dependent RNA methyltransferase [Rhodospirillales bacterium]|nr:class I SAM-dependent RNA methyltransferase [Rhodospirillales bacterium]MSP80888.1 class I SAM-dependent RNA methyltransferase [Rhodospirillales bacterium]